MPGKHVCSTFKMYQNVHIEKLICIHACAIHCPFHRSMSDALDECMTARMLRLGPGGQGVCWGGMDQYLPV